jgi:hypothetical protein
MDACPWQRGRAEVVACQVATYLSAAAAGCGNTTLAAGLQQVPNKSLCEFTGNEILASDSMGIFIGINGIYSLGNIFYSVGPSFNYTSYFCHL